MKFLTEETKPKNAQAIFSEAIIISAFIQYKEFANYTLNITCDPPDALIKMPDKTIWLEAACICDESIAKYLHDGIHTFKAIRSEHDHNDLFLLLHLTIFL